MIVETRFLEYSKKSGLFAVKITSSIKCLFLAFLSKSRGFGGAVEPYPQRNVVEYRLFLSLFYLVFDTKTPIAFIANGSFFLYKLD
jgi:hypothetical protein